MADVGHAFLKLLPTVTGLRAAVRKEVQRVEDDAPTLTIGAGFSAAVLGKSVRAAIERVEANAPPITLGTRISAAELRAQIRDAARESRDETVTVATEADTAPAARQLDRLRRDESGRSIDLTVTLDKSLGATLRGLSALDNGITSTTATITRHTATVGASTLRYAALAAAAGQLVTVLGGLGSAAATASGSLLILPAAGIAAAVALNVLKLGTQGFGDALAETDPAKFADAIATMPPAMAGTASAVRALQTDFAGLRLDVQERLFAGLADEVGDLGTLYLPVMRQGLADMADSLNASGRGFGVWARQARTVDDVRIILDNSAVSMGELSNGVAPVLSGLRDIAAVGSGFLPASFFHADSPSDNSSPSAPPLRSIVTRLSFHWVSIFSSSRVVGFHDSRP